MSKGGNAVSDLDYNGFFDAPEFDAEREEKLKQFVEEFKSLEAKLTQRERDIEGETLRDRIFCAALTGLIATNWTPQGVDLNNRLEFNVRVAYEYADEAMRQREGK
jgi:hypothetical protein